MNKRYYSIFVLFCLFCWLSISSEQQAFARNMQIQAADPGSPEQPAGSVKITYHAGPVVALTFDDGPEPLYTQPILRILQRYHVQATFFCIGQRVVAYPALARALVQAGNTLGNHSWSHPDLTKLAPEAIEVEVERTSQAIERVTGVAPRMFRAPFGATNETVAQVVADQGLEQVGWTLDTYDWQRPGVAAIVDRVLKQAKNGDIILMHDEGGDRSQTVQALPRIISGLLRRGFRFVPVEQLALTARA